MFPKSGHFLQFSKRVGEASPFLPSATHESFPEFRSIPLNIQKHPWKRLNKQFWLYARFLNMHNHLICLTGFWDVSGPKKARVLNMVRLFMQGLRWVPNIFDYGPICLNNAEICLNMPQYCWLSLIRLENAWMNCSHKERTREFSGQRKFCGIWALQ